jgi:hypothetical protein
LISGATGERNCRKPGGDKGAGGRRGPRADAVAREEGASRGGGAVDEQRGDAWAGKTQKMAGGGQIPSTVPAAGDSEQNRGAETPGGRKGKGCS